MKPTIYDNIKDWLLLMLYICCELVGYYVIVVM